MRRVRLTLCTLLLIPAIYAVTVAAACGSSSTPEATLDGVLTIDAPANDATVSERSLTIRGAASPNEEVRRDKRLGSDEKIKADAAGRWQFDVELDEGENEYTFFLQNDKDTRAKVSVTYDPPEVASAGTAVSASVTPAETRTAATATPTGSATAAPAATAPAATPSLPETLPGIAAADVTINLENRGFDCTGPDVLQTLVSWTCKDPVAWVDLLGESPTRIRSVSATSFEPTDAAALALLGYIATLPYDGAEPERARAWLAANIATGGGIVIGAASFNVYGPAGGRTLEVVASGVTQ